MTNSTTTSSSRFSKRTRFEILRRDNHTCRYCGAKAPDVKLEVDHVVPVALGGSNDPSNGVTACEDCNRGKASVPADTPIVEDVIAHDQKFRDTLRELLEEQGREIVEEYKQDATYAKHILDYWCDQISDDKVHYPAIMDGTLKQWRRLGVPHSLIVYAIDETAMRAKWTWDDSRKWRYACAIVWRRVGEATKEASK